MSEVGFADRTGGGTHLLLLGLLALLGVVVTVMLGNWQSARAREKAQLQARYEAARSSPAVVLDARAYDAASVLFNLVQAHGRFLEQHTILLDNRLRKGIAGYEVVTPLSLDGRRAVLVNRGWVRAPQDRASQPEVTVSAGEVSLIGLALPISTRYVELSRNTVSGRLWQNLDFERYRQQTGLDLLPLVLQQQDPGSDGLDRDWPRPDLRIDTNRSYALQWYTLAAAIAISYVIYYVRSKRRRS